MSQSLPFLLIPGLACSPRLYQHQIPALWRFGPVTVADHTRADTMAGIANSILESAPPRFHAVALSMGGHILFELLRQAPERIAKIVILDSAARADVPEQTERRRKLIALAEQGRLREVNDVLWPLLVDEKHRKDAELRAIADIMIEEVGAAAFVRQQRALIARIDSRPTLPRIKSPALVVVGEGDTLTPPELSREIADGIPGARLELVAECGHLSTLEQPAAITGLLTDWFATPAVPSQRGTR